MVFRALEGYWFKSGAAFNVSESPKNVRICWWPLCRRLIWLVKAVELPLREEEEEEEEEENEEGEEEKEKDEEEKLHRASLKLRAAMLELRRNNMAVASHTKQRNPRQIEIPQTSVAYTLGAL